MALSFDAAYTEGVTDAVAPPGGAQAEVQELLTRAAPADETVAFHGCVLTPERAIEHGYVVVAGKQIQAVQEDKPDGVRIHEVADGVIMPGLIDLHGHPEFNIFAPWEPPQQFANRYEWRASDIYHELVRDPQNRLLKALPPQTQLRYAEIRALVGGVTAIQGSGGRATSSQDGALVRNVDKWIFGGQVGRAMIDLPVDPSPDLPELQKVLTAIAAGDVKAFYLHLCEGRPDDARSQEEFKSFIELKALTSSTVVIHGTSLTKDQLGELHDGGAKLVWSPQSNLRLYGETTQAAAALELGLPVGLGADWLPSGSTSLLAELKVARRVLISQGAKPTPQQLVDMVTRDAAKIAGLDDKLGELAEGRPADLAIFERRFEDPWENVVEADPSSVELVMIDGGIAYGRKDWLLDLIAPADQTPLESIIAWGREMCLDVRYDAGAPEAETPSLAALRTDLIEQYKPLGPIFA